MGGGDGLQGGRIMRYEAPQTLEAAIALLRAAGAGAKVLAGGTDLLVQLRAGAVEPELAVDIKRIPGMGRIRAEAGGLRIGAAVPGAEIGAHAGLVAAWPGVVEAIRLIGSDQIQSRATAVGNLCNASPAADGVPALIAAGATARIAGPDGGRDLPVEEVATGPGQTALAEGELVASLFLPTPVPRSGDAYLRFIPRSEMDIAVVGAGVALTLDGDGRCTAARVALGAVAPRAVLVDAAALVGSRLEEEALRALAAAAAGACRPIDDKRGTAAYRTRVAGVLARRAAIIAKSRAEARL